MQEVQVQLDEHDLNAMWHRRVLSTDALTKRNHAIISWSIFALMLVFLPSYLTHHKFGFAHYVVAIGAVAYIIWTNVRDYSSACGKKWAKGALAEPSGVIYSVSISPEQFGLRSASHSVQTGWDSVKAIASDAERTCFDIGESSVIVVPRRAFADQQAYDDFASQARAYSEAAQRFDRCPECQYDLQANPTGGCPECGWRRQETVKS